MLLAATALSAEWEADARRQTTRPATRCPRTRTLGIARPVASVDPAGPSEWAVGPWRREFIAERKSHRSQDHCHVRGGLTRLVTPEMPSSGVDVALTGRNNGWGTCRVVVFLECHRSLGYGDEHWPRVRMPSSGSSGHIVVGPDDDVDGRFGFGVDVNNRVRIRLDAEGVAGASVAVNGGVAIACKFVRGALHSCEFDSPENSLRRSTV